ncbi:hypothetical protein SKAU_G00424820 [Synaphobranchus kaupii]|uniref:Zinc finger protein 862-like n=1 Tax=Synaphobranchus kaupii TaxID=118154 RepID=A0A9Q1E5M7_SYNKA|nr:hypothetical protein SKAU_G00424820 [Synaphobranchus kaupii]
MDSQTICLEQLKSLNLPQLQDIVAINAALEKVGLNDWKEKTVGFGSDGAAVMVGRRGRRGGVSTLLRQEIPHLINIRCLGHGLELAAMETISQHANMKKVTDLLRGLYKQYHYSPKAWRELRDLAEILNIKIWKPANLGGTRWLPHIEKALNTLMRDYTPVLTHMENTLETRSASADMLGIARQCTQLLFVGLVQDILQVLSCMATTPGECLERFLEDTEDEHFHSVPLHNCSQESRDGFAR